MKKIFMYCFTITVLISCGGKEEIAEKGDDVKSNNNTESTYHVDRDYKYEYRTGTTGNYEYNYDVVGTDEDGYQVEGKVDMEGRYGSGIITDADGNEKEVEIEWVDYGEMEATDEDGYIYNLQAE